MAKKARRRKTDLSRPRRFEFVDGSSAKFWTIWLEEQSHTVQFGRLGTLGQTKTKEFGTREQAEASYRKLVEDKLKKGYEEQIPLTATELRREKKRHEPFLKEILADPDAPGPYAVYADWLSEQGDPRGEFIQVQLQLEDESLTTAQRKELRKQEKQLLARHEETWLGSLAPLLLENPIVRDGEQREQRTNFTYRFERGFLASLRVARLYVPVARAIRDAEQTRFLRQLIIESIEHYWEPNSGYGEDDPEYAYELGDDVPTWEKDRIQFVSVYPLLGVKEFSCLHSFQVGFVGEADDVWTKTPPTSRPGDSHCYCNPASDLVAKMPRLRHLDLLCKEFDVRALFSSKKLKHLKSLRIYHLGNRGGDRQERREYGYPLELLAKNRAFASLEALAFHPHYEEYHSNYPAHASFLPLSQIRHLLNSRHLKNLTRLQLRLSDMGDEGCREIVRSGILKQLKWLDLRHGEITDEGARILAECPDLKNLEYLDLARNGLTREGVRVLRRTKVPFQADNQLTPAELSQQEYLHDGDFE